MPNEWFTSDTHFNHKNIIKYCNRPFSSVEEMNDTMISNWNQLVKPEDTIFHLGDFAFGRSESIKSILSSLNGRKILVLGNHDRSLQRMRDLGFDVVSRRYRRCYIGRSLIMCHKVQHASKCEFALVGHVHDAWKFRTVNNIKAMNVGVDVCNFYPVNLDEILKWIRSSQ